MKEIINFLHSKEFLTENELKKFNIMSIDFLCYFDKEISNLIDCAVLSQKKILLFNSNSDENKENLKILWIDE
jgi:hypothetical protein